MVINDQLKMTLDFDEIPGFPIFAVYDFFVGPIVPIDPTKFNKWKIGVTPKLAPVHCGPLNDPEGQGLLNTTADGIMGLENLISYIKLGNLEKSLFSLQMR